ncbi:3-dehydroquinate synthase [Rossellomorea sp. BNER]|uniref:3-dehydroquinate synthase n=1 Tax=Rossellomorea sp. BNER TaxID=2962031 RepID=UPI003AF1E475|nr:3-dehydroquinate synthase [Rossellomorea sp. BNER]
MESLMIETQSKSYPVFIGKGAIGRLEEWFTKHLPQASQLLMIADEEVFSLHGERLVNSLPEKFPWSVIKVPAGEKAKTFQTYENCLSDALEKELDRESVVIAFGGGAIGDLAGFVASTYMRGVAFIQIPTTILAHDSAVGGKVAINHEKGKNMVGQFYQPEAVFYDLNFLSTLPMKEIRSGMAEVIKHALIADPELLDELIHDLKSLEKIEANSLESYLKAGIKIKAKIVSQDERETGVRAYLNFGHTYGHAIENVSGYGSVTHGEAVMVGIIFALYISKETSTLPLDLERFTRWVISLGYNLSIIDNLPFEDLYNAMKRDKKSSKSKPRFVVLEEVGQPKLKEVDIEYLHRADQFIRNR